MGGEAHLSTHAIYMVWLTDSMLELKPPNPKPLENLGA
jgi:hypothetical protein